jgi:type IV pilus biogenesis protein CpaD/CtpE
MKKAVKMLAAGLITLALAGCDNGDSQTQNDIKTDVVQPTDSVQRIELLDGRFSFTVPDGVNDRNGQLANQTNNMRVFADESGARNVVSLITEAEDTNLQVAIEALANQYVARDSSAKVMVKEPISLSDHPAWRLDMISYSKGQSTYSSIVMITLDDELITLQISVREGGKIKPEAVVASVIDSIQIK